MFSRNTNTSSTKMSLCHLSCSIRKWVGKMYPTVYCLASAWRLAPFEVSLLTDFPRCSGIRGRRNIGEWWKGEKGKHCRTEENKHEQRLPPLFYSPGNKYHWTEWDFLPSRLKSDQSVRSVFVLFQRLLGAFLFPGTSYKCIGLQLPEPRSSLWKNRIIES